MTCIPIILLFLLFTNLASAQLDSFLHYEKIANDYSLSNLDSCEVYSRKCLFFSTSDVQKISALNSLAGCQYLNNKFEQVCNTINELESVLKEKKKLVDPEEIYACSNISAINRKLGNINEAISWQYKAIANLDSIIVEPNYVARLYFNLGSIYKEIGDYYGAINAFKYYTYLSEINNENYTKANCFIAEAFLNTGNIDSTLRYINKFSVPTMDKRLIALKTKILGSTLLKTGKFQKFRSLVSKPKSGNNPYLDLVTYELMGDYYYKLNNFQSSQKNYFKALELQKLIENEDYGISIQRIKYKMGRNYLILKDYTAINSILTEFYQNSLGNNYAVLGREKFKSLDLSSLGFLELNIEMNEILNSEYHFNNLTLIDSYFSLCKKLFAKINYDESRFLFVKQKKHKFNIYIKILTSKYLNCPKDEIYRRIISNISITKGFKSYIDLVMKNNFHYYQEAPIEIIKSIKIEKEINTLEKQLYNTKKPKNQINKIRKEIFLLHEKKNILLTKIPAEIRFNFLFDHSWSNYFISPKQSVIIETFDTPNIIYLFSTSDNEFLIDTIIKGPFISDVKQIRYFVKNPDNTFLNPTLSHNLYKTLIEPCLTEDTKTIIFIPDGDLSTIPIEMLLTDPDDPTSYLVKKYAVNYQYSAQLWVQSQTREKRDDFTYDFAGFAPSFSGPIAENVRDCSGTELGYLACNQDEVTNISQLVPYAKPLTGLDASITNFEKIASQSRILHLATHSCFELDNPDLSRIYFTDDYYATADLALMNLDNELTVLSACNTGYGAILPGEGVMSLAKGFFQANCRSLLTSQWSIDDCVTPKILEKYYHHLLQGERKDRALQLAKIEFLEENPGLQQHPYFWAGLVQYGDCSPIQFTRSPWQKAWPYLLLFFPVGMGWYFRLRDSRKLAA